MTPRTRPALLLVAGVLLHAALYARGLGGTFTFDDRKIVVDHGAVSGREPLAGVVSREYFPKARPSEGIDYRPLTLLSLGVDVRLFGLSAAAMRLENLLLAGLGAGLFAWLAAELGAGAFATWGTLVLLSCLPVRSEAILSVVGRSELLAFALVSGALLAARRAFAGGAARAALSGALLALALFAKENAFAAPGLLAALALLERHRGARPRLAALVTAWGAAFALAFAARFAVLGGLMTGPLARLDPFDNALAGMPPLDRAAAALSLLPLAATRLVWPATLVADYGSTSFARAALLSPAAVASGAALLLCAALAAALLLARGRLAGFGVAWTLVAYVPFANLVFPTGTAFAERLLYVPAAGVALALAAGLARLPRAGAVGVAALLALVGTLRVEARVPEWRDDRALFSAVVRDLPENGRAWFDLAVLSLSAGEDARAGIELSAALRADPRLVPAARGLLANASRIRRPSAERAIREALAAQ